MKMGLLGLPGSGKTTCFRILSGHHGTDTHHGAQVATVPLPDPRLDRIQGLYASARRTYPDVTFVDFEALHKGEAAHGELALHKASGDCDALALVVQCFGQLDHLGDALSPADDLETLLLEMTLSDLAITEKHLERISTGPRAERNPQDIELMQRCRDHLGAGGLLHTLSLSADEAKHLRGFAPLTLKPALVVFNLAEDDLHGERIAGARAASERLGLPHLEICAELEQEIAELPPDDRLAFLADYGLDASAHDRFVRDAFSVLDLITFFTANDKEAHGWTIKRGATAPEAAGKVHSAMQDGFIRAEVIAFRHLEELGSVQACKERGFMRVEGKDYVVAEGDVLQVRFSR